MAAKAPGPCRLLRWLRARRGADGLDLRRELLSELVQQVVSTCQRPKKLRSAGVDPSAAEAPGRKCLSEYSEKPRGRSPGRARWSPSVQGPLPSFSGSRSSQRRARLRAAASEYDFIDFLTVGLEGRPGKTVPESALGALSLLEQLGGVREDVRISRDPVVIAVTKNLTMEREYGAPEVKRARPLPVAILISLELYIVGSSSRYRRFWAFIKLLKSWGCLRYDDVQGILVGSFSVSASGFSFKIGRTKTTGPGRKHGVLKAFVSRECCLSGQDWQGEGLKLLAEPDFCRARDYFLPVPKKGLGEAGRGMLGYSDAAALSRALLCELRLPVKLDDGTWSEGDQLALPGDLPRGFSEHSERHFLPGASAAEGSTPAERNFLGRWQVDRSAAAEYVLTSRQVVAQVQKRTARWLRGGQAGARSEAFFEEDDLLNELLQEFPAEAHAVDRLRLCGPEGLGAIEMDREGSAPAPDAAGLPLRQWTPVTSQGQRRRSRPPCGSRSAAPASAGFTVEVVAAIGPRQSKWRM